MGLPQKQISFFDMYYHSVAKRYKHVSHCSPSYRMRAPLPPSSSPQYSSTPPPPQPSTLRTTPTAMQEIHTLILPCPPPFSSAMAAVAFPDTSSATALHKKPTHRRDTSDELDVFEAASYYSGVADATFRSGISLPYGTMKEESRGLGGGMRRSVDVPMREPVLPSQSHKGEKPAKEKETKQPISPGGRLASLLNSFFHQGSSKKKSKSVATTPSTTQYSSCKDEDSESPSGRRKRSSVSHSRSTGSSDSSLFHSSSSSFRTPSLLSPHGKVKEDPRTSLRNKCSGQATLAAPCAASAEAFHEGRSCSYGDLPWERRRRASTNGIFEKGVCSNVYGTKNVVLGVDAAYCGGLAEKKWVLNKDSKGMTCRDLLRAEEFLATERNLWRREKVVEEDGGESDSSSDLFELPNCDLVHLAGGLPVYESTTMGSIKRGTSMASVTL